MKKLALTVAMTLCMVLGANAQYFENNRQPSGPNAGGGLFGRGGFPESGMKTTPTPLLPQHGMGSDQSAPLGGGVALLLGFGAAYAMSKRKKED